MQFFSHVVIVVNSLTTSLMQLPIFLSHTMNRKTILVQNNFEHLLKHCWRGLITRSFKTISNFGRMLFTRKASILPLSKMLTHGWSIDLAELSDGCHLVRALLSFCRIVGYTLVSKDCPATKTFSRFNSRLISTHYG